MRQPAAPAARASARSAEADGPDGATGIKQFAGPCKASGRGLIPHLERGARRPGDPREARLRLVLYEPDIPQNAGTMMRLCACLDLPLELVEPCGFLLSDRHLRRAGMDYLDHLRLARHRSFAAFEAWRRAALPGARLLLLTTRGERAYHDFAYRPDDLVMVGRESVGVPESVHGAADARLRIPMAPGRRSLNVALAASMVLGEALRQTGDFPA